MLSLVMALLLLVEAVLAGPTAPARATSPRAALEFAKRDGAAVLTGVGVSAAAVSAAAADIFGAELLAVQAPVHVGTNNFGFKGASPITNLDARPAHVDTIVQYSLSPYEAPDYFLLCASRPAADGGGASFVVDLPAAIARMPPADAARLRGLEFVQTIALPPGYDRLGENSSARTQAPAAADATPAPAEYDRLERFVTPNPRAAWRAAHRVSSFSDAASLLVDLDDAAAVADGGERRRGPVRAASASADPAADMRLVTAFLRAVEEETAASARFLLAEGDCAVVDNLRMAHGREAYADLGRALWQVWVWTNTSIAVPELAGPNREWVRHPSTAPGVVGECSS